MAEIAQNVTPRYSVVLPAMFNIKIRYLVIALLLLFSAALSVEAQMLKTKDGTNLVGVIVAEPFTIKTRYGVLKVPVSDMVQIIEGEVWLKNASHFFGKIEPQMITVKTDYGELKISTEQIIWLNFVKKEEPKRIED